MAAILEARKKQKSQKLNRRICLHLVHYNTTLFYTPKQSCFCLRQGVPAEGKLHTTHLADVS